MRYLALFFILLQGMLCSWSSPKPTLHLLILYDGYTTKYMSNPHTTDSLYIKKTFHSITSALSLPITVTESPMQEFSTKQFREWTQKVVPAQDIAIVYYSGPQKEDEKTLLPSVRLSQLSELEVINASALSDSVFQRNPRFALICFDCYEKIVPFTKSKVRVAKPLSKKDGMKYRKCFHELFLNNHRSLLLSSPRQGETGYGIDFNIGTRQGAFTRALLTALNHPKRSWRQMTQKMLHSLHRKPFPKQNFFLKSANAQQTHS